ncbi:unnamed protein product, partial [Sphagnum troendelagicum]
MLGEEDKDSNQAVVAGGGAHVVAFPFPAQGHIAPMVQLSKTLASYGIAITFIIATPHLASVRALVEDSFEGHGKIQIICFEIPPQYVNTDMHNFYDLMFYLPKNKHEVFAEIVQKLMAPQDVTAFNHHQPSPISHSSSSTIGSFWFSSPVCIISDMLLGWTQDTATKFKIPRYCLYTCAARSLSMIWHATNWVAQGLIPMPLDAAKPLQIPGFPPLSPIDLPEVYLQGNEMKFPPQRLVDYAKKHKEATGEPPGCLFWCSYQVANDALNVFLKLFVPTIFTIGPLLLTHNNKLEESKVDGIDNDCLQFLNQQPRSSVLYICFGTVFVLPTQQLNELAMGLETSGVRFLWVIRIPKGEDGNLAPEIATLIPKGFMERTKDKGLVYTSWAPQAQILAHPATGGFLTHCGWNSIMESISMGVPMITWPLYADQMLNGRFCVDVLNIAIAVDKKFKEIVGRKEVERVVQLLMQDATSNIVRKNARELKKVVRNANEPGGSSRKSLDLFVDDLN